MSLGPGLRCVSTTGGTATSERTFWSFWERVEEGNWKRYKIGDSVVVARRFRSVPRSCPRLLSGLGQVFFLFSCSQGSRLCLTHARGTRSVGSRASCLAESATGNKREKQPSRQENPLPCSSCTPLCS